MKKPAPKTKPRTRRRSFGRRPLTRTQRDFWTDQGEFLLSYAAELWRISADFDSAVRDSIARGLAYIVHAAFDCNAIAFDFQDFESSNAYIDNRTAAWFRERGYAEWFCAGAAALFNITPPRQLTERQAAIVVEFHGKKKPGRKPKRPQPEAVN